MLSISNPKSNGASAVAYYLHGKEDYYLKGQDQEGRWFGAGATLLGLQGKVVERGVFRNLLEGFSPDGTVKLVPNAGHPHRQRLLDLTLNDPKAVSVLWALAPEEYQGKIVQARDEAAKTALRCMEHIAGYTRRGKAGRIKEKAALLFALFPETTSRSLDPHLHTHAVLINLAFRQDGTTGTLHNIRFFELKKVFGKLYQNELAKNLRKLGLIIELEKVGFHVAGVPRELCRAYSRRRQQIEEWLKQNGRDGAIAAKEAALQTRPRKQDVAPAGLFVAWQKMAEEFGWGPEQVAKLFQNRTPQRTLEPTIEETLQELIVLSRTNQRDRQWTDNRSRPLAKAGECVGTATSRSRRKELYSSTLPFFRIEWHPLFDKTPWILRKGRLVCIEWQSVFPTLPSRRLRNLRVPVISLALPGIAIGPKKEFKPRYWTIREKHELLLGELRAQDRILFPNAPKWSPLHGLSLPALRITGRRSEWQPIDLDQELDHSRSR